MTNIIHVINRLTFTTGHSLTPFTNPRRGRSTPLTSRHRDKEHVSLVTRPPHAPCLPASRRCGGRRSCQGLLRQLCYLIATA